MHDIIEIYIKMHILLHLKFKFNLTGNEKQCAVSKKNQKR